MSNIVGRVLIGAPQVPRPAGQIAHDRHDGQRDQRVQAEEQRAGGAVVAERLGDLRDDHLDGDQARDQRGEPSEPPGSRPACTIMRPSRGAEIRYAP